MMLESLGVLSRWTIEVKVRKDAALISWGKKKKKDLKYRNVYMHLSPEYIDPRGYTHHKLLVRNLQYVHQLLYQAIIQNTVG